MAVTKLAGSASLQFVRHTPVGVYIRRSRYAEVINRCINTPIALKELMVIPYGLSLSLPSTCYRKFGPLKVGIN